MVSRFPALPARERGLASRPASSPRPALPGPGLGRVLTHLYQIAQEASSEARDANTFDAADLDALSTVLFGVGRLVIDSRRPSDASKPPPDGVVKVAFYGEEIEVIRQGNEAWLPLRPLCERFGLDVEGQRKKLRGCAWAVAEEISATGSDGKTYRMTCLHLRSLAGWLFSIKPGKVAPEVREGLVRYQREAAEVLFKHLFGIPCAPAPHQLPAQPDAGAALVRGFAAHARAAQSVALDRHERASLAFVADTLEKFAVLLADNKPGQTLASKVPNEGGLMLLFLKRDPRSPT